MPGRCCTSTVCTTPPTSWSTSSPSEPTSSPARRTSSSVRIAVCSPPIQRCLESLVPDKLLASTMDVPERFELGTLPYELMAGAAAAVDFLADARSTGRRPSPPTPRRGSLLRSTTTSRRCVRRSRPRWPTSMASRSIPEQRAAHRPCWSTSTTGRRRRSPGTSPSQGINAPSGSFYALEASRHLGLGDDGALRIGLAPYTDRADVERLLAGITSAMTRGTEAELASGRGSQGRAS